MSTSTVSVPLALVRITGMYAAVAVVAIGAAHATAAFHGIHDTRAGELSLAAVIVMASLWLYSIYQLLRANRHEQPIDYRRLEPPDRPPGAHDVG